MDSQGAYQLKRLLANEYHVRLHLKQCSGVARDDVPATCLRSPCKLRKRQQPVVMIVMIQCIVGVESSVYGRTGYRRRYGIFSYKYYLNINVSAHSHTC